MHIEAGIIAPQFAMLSDVLWLCAFLLLGIFARSSAQVRTYLRSGNLLNIQTIILFCLFGDLLAVPFVPLDIHVLLSILTLLSFPIIDNFYGLGIVVALEAILGDGGILNLGLNLANIAILLPLVFVLLLKLCPSLRPDFRNFKRSEASMNILKLGVIISSLLIFGVSVVWGEYFTSSWLFGYPPMMFVDVVLPLLGLWFLIEVVLNTIIIFFILSTSKIFQKLIQT